MGLWFKKQASAAGGAPAWLIVGLGNPGREYELTRHNVGFLFLDRLAEKTGCRVTKLKFKSLYGDATVGGVRCLLAKPQTFMNASGEAVRDIAAFYKIPPERIVAVFDDSSLDVGVLRIRRHGSDGGHNGVKSLIYQLNSDVFPRIKIGIGQKPDPRMDLADYVLGRIPPADEKLLAPAIDRAVEAVALMVQGKIDQAMNEYN